MPQHLKPSFGISAEVLGTMSKRRHWKLERVQKRTVSMVSGFNLGTYEEKLTGMEALAVIVQPFKNIRKVDDVEKKK